MGAHSSILVWRIPWTEEPGGLQSKGSDMTERLCTHIFSCRNKAMLITVFGNYFSFFSHSLFLGPSEALHNICGLQNPASLRDTANADARQEQPWFLYVLRCPCFVTAKLGKLGRGGRIDPKGGARIV